MYEEYDVNLNEHCLYEKLIVTNILRQKKCDIVIFRDENNKKVKEWFSKREFNYQKFAIGEVYEYYYTGSFIDSFGDRVDSFSIRNKEKNFNLYFTEDGRQIILGWGGK